MTNDMWSVLGCQMYANIGLAPVRTEILALCNKACELPTRGGCSPAKILGFWPSEIVPDTILVKIELYDLL